MNLVRSVYGGPNGVVAPRSLPSAIHCQRPHVSLSATTHLPQLAATSNQLSGSSQPRLTDALISPVVTVPPIFLIVLTRSLSA